MHERTITQVLDPVARRKIAKACKALQAKMKGKYAFLRVGSEEWTWAWEGLAAYSGDEDFAARDPRSGEIWQYMCTVLSGGGWFHEFRHRWHPRKRRRLVLRVLASGSWKPDLEKRKKRRALH